MKVYNFLIIAVLVICLAGCAALQVHNRPTKEAPGTKGTTETSHYSGLPNNTTGGQSNKGTDGLDWTFSVNNTISGSYKLPAGGKALEYDITLRIVAWKSGGEDSFGKYEGEGYILFEFDESGLSNTELTYLGGGAFNRRCESLEFEIEESDQGAMASFQSNWYTTLSMDQTVEDRESGDTLSDIEGEFGGTTNKMGITLLI
ncbi:MAG: hypothetical protein PHV32_02555, partial [Eubacteriales bacterium]|nr:hypothetical protein [Eubacteriales bacterium]